MKAKDAERQLAITLRKQGYSYSEIQQKILVSKASLSLWLSQVVLTTDQQIRLANLSKRGQKLAATARHRVRIEQQDTLRNQASKEFVILKTDPFFMYGLALYQAEGTKEKPWTIGSQTMFANSDPVLILTMQEWFLRFCNVGDSQISYRLYIHETANIDKARDAWGDKLGINSERISVSVKRHIVRSRHKNNNYIGLIAMKVYKSTWLTRRIAIWGELAGQHFLGK